jgi:two-component system chemotaxis response regulator CheY
MPHTVLIVDDDAAVRRTTAKYFAADGYTVAEAENGEAALAYLQSGSPVNVILLDLRMPVMDGWTFRREQRRIPEFAAIPVIVLSGADVPRFFELDVAATFQKPASMTELRVVVRRLCEEPGAAPDAGITQ